MNYGYHYRKWHEDTPEHATAAAAYYQPWLGPLLPADRQAPILDVGCGMGFALVCLRSLGYSCLTGLERDPGQAESCRNKGLSVFLAEDSVVWLKSHEGQYQAVLALDLLEHIPVKEQVAFVRALAGVLRPGGRLICTAPNANSALAGRWRYIDWTHHCSFTEHSLDFLLAEGGLRGIVIEPLEFHRRPRLWWLPVGAARHWWAFRFFRLARRLEMMAELGPDQGRTVPLSLNLLATAQRP